MSHVSLSAFMGTLAQHANDRFPGKQVRVSILESRDEIQPGATNCCVVELNIDHIGVLYPIGFDVLAVPELWAFDAAVVIERDFALIFGGEVPA